ncbi:MAG: protein kinase [Polyangiaceae bacterium]|nr:protein kinase [Polyangiaceae bacterium]
MTDSPNKPAPPDPAPPPGGEQAGSVHLESLFSEGQTLAGPSRPDSRAAVVAAGRSSAPSIPPPTAVHDPYIGSTIDGRYKVEGALGEGGMGVVYRGRHKVIDKPVAIKVLRADLARDAEITERFLREARAASTIGNPHIIDISDFGTLPDGSTYFVMEFLDGKPLSGLLESIGGPVPMMRLLAIAHQIADALAAAHERQIVHRDLKPDNVFLIDRGSEKDFVKILDFGIAKVSSNTAKITRYGSVFGTPHYMSPEQAAGAPLDHRTDIYSLGVIMYEMASGKLPFDADNFMGILTQHMYQAPVPIRALVPPQDVPPGLEAIVLKCLSKKPEHRYQNMAELVEDFAKMEKGLVPDAVGDMMGRSGGFNVPADFFKSAMPAPVPATPPSMRSRHPWPLFAGIAGVLATVAIVVGIFAYGQYSTASTPNPPASSLIAAPNTPQATAAGAVNTSATTSPPAAEAPKVMVVANPIDAEVLVDGKLLGQAPQFIPVAAGAKVQVTVRRTGYVEDVFLLDGSTKRKDVVLRPRGGRITWAKPKSTTEDSPSATSKPPVAPPPPATTKSPPPPSVGGGEIVNPWAK